MRANEFLTEYDSESAADTRTLYHVSRKKNRTSILKHGLEPRTQEYSNIERKPGIYLFESLNQAREWAFWSAMTELAMIDIWKVTVPRSYQLTRDRHEEMDIYNAVIGYDTIPPEQLTVIKTQGIPKSSKNALDRAPLLPSDIKEQQLTKGGSHPVKIL